ncbi:hypothetical protein [Sulfitobacter pontiacus]|uniref:hypothetical protein n=1 Tax=Sulfitobacter pontiacus TaxID=60137 RepID=UPI0004535C6F|nr:hypothetical protein [Sulfitobacter pontiacus]KAJ30516.1 hypothetical protein PM01_11010 [Sulfitobacter pontiacus 3SOLIMAR09]
MLWILVLIAIIACFVLFYILWPIELSPVELEQAKCHGIYHITPKKNLLNIISGNNATILVSKGVYQNLGNLKIGKSAFYFKSVPDGSEVAKNLFGRGLISPLYIIHLDISKIDQKLYRRRADCAILIPASITVPVKSQRLYS